jgi:uncharacterized damage-inducible protein DinB
MTETDLRYPIGRFRKVTSLTDAERRESIEAIAAAPARLRAAVQGLTEEQLDTPYRPGGWTVRQVVHHVADSHMNAYIRFKWTLTEDNPTIRTYQQGQWAELPDSFGPVAGSLTMLEALHDRWVRLLRAMKPADFARPFNHPENGPMTLDSLLVLYDWHGRHHTAHVTGLRERMGW